jgi:hypothetical protein
LAQHALGAVALLNQPVAIVIIPIRRVPVTGILDGFRDPPPEGVVGECSEGLNMVSAESQDDGVRDPWYGVNLYRCVRPRKGKKPPQQSNR